MDIFRSENGIMKMAYQQDCCDCLECRLVCPVDAISFVVGTPKKYDMFQEWSDIKKLMNGS